MTAYDEEQTQADTEYLDRAITSVNQQDLARQKVGLPALDR